MVVALLRRYVSGEMISPEADRTPSEADSSITSTWIDRARADGPAILRAAIRADVQLSAGRPETPDLLVGASLVRLTIGGDRTAIASMLGRILGEGNHDEWPVDGSRAQAILAYMEVIVDEYHDAYAAFRQSKSVGAFLGEVAPLEARWRTVFYPVGVGLMAEAGIPQSAPPISAAHQREVLRKNGQSTEKAIQRARRKYRVVKGGPIGWFVTDGGWLSALGITDLNVYGTYATEMEAENRRERLILAAAGDPSAIEAEAEAKANRRDL